MSSKRELYHSQAFIEQYLSGALTPEELADFETYLETDEALKQAISLRKAMQEGIERAGDDEITKELEELFERSEHYDLDTQIDDYLTDNLSYSWQIHIEEQLERDEDFRQKVLFRRALLAGIRRQQQQSVAGDLAELSAITDQQKKKGEDTWAESADEATKPRSKYRLRRMANPRLLAVAATILLIISLSLFYLLQGPRPDARRQSRIALSRVASDLDPIDQLERELLSGRGLLPTDNRLEMEQTFDSLLQVVAAADYPGAVTGLLSFKERFGNDVLIDLYLGILYFKIEDHSSAIPYLMNSTAEVEVSGSFKTLRGNHIPTIARWYLALCYLHQYQPEPAIELLEHIRDLDAQQVPGVSRIQENAASLLDALK